MGTSLCLTVRFLDARFHGRRDDGEPEWPPSPLRLVQALTAVSARRTGRVEDDDRAVLEWLAALQPPIIIAAPAVTGTPVRIAVPNNDLDVLASEWARGRSPSKQASELKTLKTVRPVHIDGDCCVHYVWPGVPADSEDRIRGLRALAGSLVALGWGRDLVFGAVSQLDEAIADRLPGERWSPAPAGGQPLRVPAQGTVNDLVRRHDQFKRSVTPDGVSIPPPLRSFRVQVYQRAAAHPERSIAAFSLLTLDASRFRPFDASRLGVEVAGMMRHAARRAAVAAGWPEGTVNATVLGHAPAADGSEHVAVGPQRFAYLPLPTLEARGGDSMRVGSIRRVIVTSFGNLDDEISWARRSLNGLDLINEGTGEAVALLALVPSADSHVVRYVAARSSWATVTPMLLPGYDDPRHLRRRMAEASDAVSRRRYLVQLAERTEQLIRKAIAHAGYSAELAEHSEIEWRPIGLFAGAGRANDYRVPSHLRRFPAVHCRVRWLDRGGRPVEVGGPICVGAGRFYGIGLFAPY